MQAQKEGPYGLTVEGFDLTDDMMGEMRVVKASGRESREREEGVVLCHAGKRCSFYYQDIWEKVEKKLGKH